MRTTLTIEPDVAAQLRKLEKRHPQTFKSLINTLLRLGLTVFEEQHKKKSPPITTFTKPARLGKLKIGSLDDVSEVLALGEGEEFG